ncbi:MAG: c-type cytochrome [Deltaproteobacteria bacterium]|nr:c-type cytochrome [Deltaproteobacteria bacterium]
MKKNLLLVALLLLTTSCQKSCRDSSSEVSMQRGKALYTVHCASCHGNQGDGKGPAASLLWPKPRDFTIGIFKYRTHRGLIPTDLDLLQTMKMGIPGSSMPGWDVLKTNDWYSILTYFKTLSPKLSSEKQGAPIDIPEETKTTPESIQEGRQLYEKRGCIACHGPGGKGDGPGAIVLKDVWGDRIAPRDLTEGPLKWGNLPRDIYRTLMIGVPGTPMPSYEQTFTKKELWSLVHYIQSIQKPFPKDYDPSNPKRNLLIINKINGKIPMNYKEEAWAKSPKIPVFLKPLWHEPGNTEWITVQALHTEEEVAFYLRWADDKADRDSNQNDGVAIQLPMDKISNPADLPYLGIGSSSQKIDLWQWKDNGVLANGVYDQGEWHVILKRSRAPSNDNKAPLTDVGYVSFELWDGDQPKHAGPTSFSEWMIYELRP